MDPTATEPATPRSRRRSAAAKAVLALWALVLALGVAAGTYRYRTAYPRFAAKALGENIRYIELAPDPAAPPVRVTRPSDIAVVRAWLIGASPSPPPGAAVHPADCPVAVVFGDGTVQRLTIGFAGGPANLNPMSSAAAEIRWNGYTRYADAGVLSRRVAGAR